MLELEAPRRRSRSQRYETKTFLLASRFARLSATRMD